MNNDSITGILIDFVIETAKFVSHTPAAPKTIAMACASLAFSSIMFMIMLCMGTHDRAVDRKYGLDRDPDEDLIMTFEYSGDGTLEIREGGCRILRSGASVSTLINNILSITCNEDADNRIVSIVYEDPGSNPRMDNKTKTEKIRCGRMSDEAYDKLRRYMLQQAGG